MVLPHQCPRKLGAAPGAGDEREPDQGQDREVRGRHALPPARPRRGYGTTRSAAWASGRGSPARRRGSSCTAPAGRAQRAVAQGHPSAPGYLPSAWTQRARRPAEVGGPGRRRRPSGGPVGRKGARAPILSTALVDFGGRFEGDRGIVNVPTTVSTLRRGLAFYMSREIGSLTWADFVTQIDAPQRLRASGRGRRSEEALARAR